MAQAPEVEAALTSAHRRTLVQQPSSFFSVGTDTLPCVRAMDPKTSTLSEGDERTRALTNPK